MLATTTNGGRRAAAKVVGQQSRCWTNASSSPFSSLVPSVSSLLEDDGGGDHDDDDDLVKHQRQAHQRLLAQPRRRPRQGPVAAAPHHPPLHQRQIPVRTFAGRADRSSLYSKPRPPTRKQRKRYHRRLRAIKADTVDKHSTPGSKAKIRRAYVEDKWNELLDIGRHGLKGTSKNPFEWSELEYDYGDAILDDIVGNTGELMSSPTPRPKYLGHWYDRYYDEVKGLMDGYKSHLAALEAGDDSSNLDALEAGDAPQDAQDEDRDEIKDVATTEARLPTDREIGRLVRAYRDKHGTKKSPVGIVPVLELLLTKEDNNESDETGKQQGREQQRQQEQGRERGKGGLGLPLSTFGEYTYHALLSCAKNPTEARRIFHLMRNNPSNPVQPGPYAYSILVDIHARRGDFRGCDAVMNEMIIPVENGGPGIIPPPLAAYTSLLAACYKACHSTLVPTALKAEAGQLGWERWKECRIVGHDADVMTYGAFLRLLAARGRAEQAVDVLDEMDSFNVKPTTLCFTAALKAVTKAHNIALRFEGGKSTKNRRREMVAAHHGKLARQIVIKAEQAEVDQDEGFVSALIGVCGAVGDVATAKAVYLASRVRQMDGMRMIGGEDHLARLRGEEVEGGEDYHRLEDGTVSEGRRLSSAAMMLEGGGRDASSSSSSDGVVAPFSSDSASVDDAALIDGDLTAASSNQLSPHRRRHKNKNDNRTLVALLNACASAMDSRVGTLWTSGPPHMPNKGLLDANTLLRLPERPRPVYTDNSIPGLTSEQELASGAVGYDEWEDEDVDKMSKRLRRSKKFRGLNRDPDAGYTIDELDDTLYEMLKHRSTTTTDDISGGRTAIAGGNRNTRDWLPDGLEDDENIDDTEVVGYRAEDDSIVRGGFGADAASAQTATEEEVDEASLADGIDDNQEEYYFDDDVMQWKTREVSKKKEANDQTSSFGDPVEANGSNPFQSLDERELQEELNSVPELASDDFARFYAQLQEEIEESGEDMKVDESEAMELFEMMKSQRELAADLDGDAESFLSSDASMDGESFEGVSDEEFEKFFGEMKNNFESSVGDGDMNVEGAKAMLEQMFDTDDDGVDMDGLRTQRSEDSSISKEESFEERAAKMMAEYNAGFAAPDVIDRNVVGTPQMSKAVDEGGEMPLVATAYADEQRIIGAKVGELVEVDSDRQTSSVSNSEQDARSSTVDVAVNEDSFFDLEPMDEFERALPGLPKSRINKIRNIFYGTLGYPSMLRLVPILRENMPEYMPPGWLKNKNQENARFVMEKAEEDGTVDSHLLNAMLQVQTSSGSIDRALAYHEEQFEKYGKAPDAYSDRLVLQMLVKSERLSRALVFKEKIEARGRTLDLLSYGSLVEYYAKHEQLGSALMMLKECIATHGAPPGEKSLSKIRLMCRKRDLTDELGLEEMIGEDPLEWLRYGEEVLKRERSYRGRRDLNHSKNALLRI